MGDFLTADLTGEGGGSLRVYESAKVRRKKTLDTGGEIWLNIPIYQFSGTIFMNAQ